MEYNLIYILTKGSNRFEADPLSYEETINLLRQGYHIEIVLEDNKK